MSYTQRPSEGKRKRSDPGSVLVLVAVSLIVLFGFAALSFDLAHVYFQERWAHVATDAAAVAGVAKLGDPTVPMSQQASNALMEAEVIANTNGVTDAEIAAAPTNNYAAQIQVGTWIQPIGSAGTFEAGVAPYNAVRVPAKRSVPLYFGKVVGLSQMTPVVQSIAAIGAVTIPYGVPSNAVPNILPSSMIVSNDSAGNWGPVDVCGVLNGSQSTADAINGGGCFAFIG